MLIGISPSTEFGELLTWRFGDFHADKSRNRPITNSSILLKRLIDDIGQHPGK